MISLPRTVVGAGLLALASLPAHATVHFFTASMSSFGEPVPTSTATGSASFSFDDVAFTVGVGEVFAGIASNMSGNHIHCCTAVAGTGSAAVALGFTGLPTGTSGTYSNSFTLTPAAFSSLLAGVQAGKAYVNIHTPGTYGGGEIRGFLVTAVPEPETYALMLGGLGALALVALRRRS